MRAEGVAPRDRAAASGGRSGRGHAWRRQPAPPAITSSLLPAPNTPLDPPRECAAGGPQAPSHRPAAAGFRWRRRQRPPCRPVAGGWAVLPAAIATAAGSAAVAGHAAAAAAGWGGGSWQRPRRPAWPVCHRYPQSMQCCHGPGEPQRRPRPRRQAPGGPCLVLVTPAATLRRLQPLANLLRNAASEMRHSDAAMASGGPARRLMQHAGAAGLGAGAPQIT